MCAGGGGRGGGGAESKTGYALSRGAAINVCSVTSASLVQSMRRGWLRWRAVAADGRKRRAQISRALKTLTPEGRAMRRALNSWAVLLRQRLALRRGGLGLGLLGARPGQV